MESNISALRAVEVLGQQGLEISYDFVNDAMKEIDRDRIAEADQFLLNHFLVTFMERIKMSDKVLWNILTHKESSRKDKLGAARELRHNFDTLFQTMFDAGVFKRKLGDVTIPNMNNILDMAKAIENGEHIIIKPTTAGEGTTAGVDTGDTP